MGTRRVPAGVTTTVAPAQQHFFNHLGSYRAQQVQRCSVNNLFGCFYQRGAHTKLDELALAHTCGGGDRCGRRDCNRHSRSSRRLRCRRGGSTRDRKSVV